MKDLRHLFLVGLFAVCMFFPNLGKSKLWDRDEPRNARCAVEMLQRGDWIVPTFNDELRTHKPVMLYWLMMSAYSLFGINEFAARFWSATAAIGTTVLTFGIANKLFNRKIAVWSAFILATTLMFNVVSRAATPDSILIFFTTLSLAVFSSTSFAPDQWKPAASISRKTAIWIYGAMGLSVLAKGPIGVVLPTMIIGSYLFFRDLGPTASVSINGRKGRWDAFRWLISPSRIIKIAWRMRPITAMIAVGLVAIPWYFAVGMATNGEWLRGFLWEHNVGRATRSMEGHGGFFLIYYPVAILVGCFPWSVFAAPCIVHHVRRFPRQRQQVLFLLCWVGTYVGLFSVAQTKLPSYVAPAYPALAILISVFVQQSMAKWNTAPKKTMRWASYCLGIVGLLGMVAIPLLAGHYVPQMRHLALIGLIPLGIGIVSLILLRGENGRAYFRIHFAGAIMLCVSVFCLTAPQLSSVKQFNHLVKIIDDGPEPYRLASFISHEPSWVFYAKRPIEHFHFGQLKQAIQVLRSPNSFLITTSDGLRQLNHQVPTELKPTVVVDYFLADQQLILLRSSGADFRIAQKRDR